MTDEEIYKSYDPNQWPHGKQLYKIVWKDFRGKYHLDTQWAHSEIDAIGQCGIFHPCTNMEFISVELANGTGY